MYFSWVKLVHYCNNMAINAWKKWELASDDLDFLERKNLQYLCRSLKLSCEIQFSSFFENIVYTIFSSSTYL